MRIAQVAPLFESVPPKLYGGTERIVSYLTEELVEQGHDVTLFASGDSKTTARLVSPCAESLRLDPKCVDHLALHYVMLERVFSRSSRFDIVHFHIDYLHYPLSTVHNLTNVTTLHGRLDIDDLRPLYDAYPGMPVVSISDNQRKPLPDLNWQTTVYHGLPPELFRPRYRAGDYLAFLGRICPDKGPDSAIEIARRTGMRLKIAAKVDKVDERYYAETIRPMIESNPNVEFIGEISESQKGDFLGRAAALLFPIRWCEPFGLVVIEALACGTPVIAFPLGSVPEILKDGEGGFLVSNVDEAVEAVRRIPELSRRRCREVFERRFLAKRMADDYLKVYRQLISAKGRSLFLAHKPEDVIVPEHELGVGVDSAKIASL